jgi:hypothetical protein
MTKNKNEALDALAENNVDLESFCRIAFAVTEKIDDNVESVDELLFCIKSAQRIIEANDEKLQQMFRTGGMA